MASKTLHSKWHIFVLNKMQWSFKFSSRQLKFPNEKKNWQLWKIKYFHNVLVLIQLDAYTISIGAYWLKIKYFKYLIQKIIQNLKRLNPWNAQKWNTDTVLAKTKLNKKELWNKWLTFELSNFNQSLIMGILNWCIPRKKL